MSKKVLIGGLMGVALLAGIGSIAWASSANYAGFRAMMGDRASAVNEQNFDRFNEMHRLMLDGDYAGAQKIREELGLGTGSGCPMMAGRRSGSARNGGCPMSGGQGFADKNNNGVCDYAEGVK